MNRPMPLVGGARLPLGFIVGGLVSLAVASAWLAFEPSLAVRPHMHPHVVALTHLWLPGFLLSVCFGATYQLTPVVLGTPLAWERATWVHLALHAAGVPAMVCGFFSGRYGWVAVGGVCVASGVWVFAANVCVTFVRSGRRDAIGWSLPLAAGWLALTVLAGLTIAMGRCGVALPVSPLALLRAHAHAGLAGFFLTLVQGVAFQLVPMFTLGEMRKPWRIAAGLAGSQSGLVMLTSGLALEWTIVTWTGAVLLAGGVAFSGIELAATFGRRRKPKLEPGLNAFAMGAAAVAMSVAGGVVLLWMEPGDDAVRGALAYGVVVIAGALALMVMGMLCKIIPFLVWMRAYGPRVGRQPVPAAHTLGNAGWERAWLGLHAAGVVMLAIGAYTDSPICVRAGAWLLTGGVAFFVLNSVRVMSHLRTSNENAAPVTEALTPQPKHL